jgi:hypothetical protein
MKRLLAALFLALLVALAVVTGTASASHNDQPNPPNDFTTGAGTVSTTAVLPPPAGLTVIENKFSFSAHDVDASSDTPEARNGQYHAEGTVAPTGATPPGQPVLQNVDVQGRVTCVRVQGNRAYFGGPVEKSSNPAFEGQFAFFDVVDNDQPPSNGAIPDQFRFEMLRPTPFCLTPIIGLPLTSGNIVVHDGQPNSPGPTAPTEEQAPPERPPSTE